MAYSAITGLLSNGEKIGFLGKKKIKLTYIERKLDCPQTFQNNFMSVVNGVMWLR